MAVRRRAVGDIRLRVRSAEGEPVFVGIAPQAAASAYLDHTGYDQISSIVGTRADYRPHPGQALLIPPGAQTWVASASGTGTREIT